MAAASFKELLAEFVGTFILMFTIGCNVMSHTGAWAGVSIACALMVGIYALAPISGANFNPAVSFALGMTGKMEWNKVGVYAAAQTVAGMLAGLSFRLLFGKGFPLGPSMEFSWRAAGMCELLYTFVLCFVVLNTAASAANDGRHQFYGLAIGFVIVAGAYGAGIISGGCFNPAVALGVEAGSLDFGYSPVYIVFQLAGSALAAMLFQVVRPKDFEERSSDAFKAGLSAPPAGLQAKVVSEVIGTYVLVLTVGLNVMAASPSGAFSIAAALMCMIFSLGDVSGGHFNPAVTTATVMAKKGEGAKEAGIYVGAQVFGGLLAAITYTMIYGWKSFALQPGKGFGFGGVMVAETFFTFLLCFVVLCVACSPSAAAGKYSEVFALAIGSCVTVGGCAIGGVSGGSLNPAVSLGIAAGDVLGDGNVAGIFKWGVAYTIFEVMGAAAAAGVYLGTHGEGKEKESEV